MKNARRTMGLAVMLLAAAALFTVAQSGLTQEEKAKAKPLTEAALIKLAKSDLEDEVIVSLVKKRGVSFKVDEAALKRLKKAGVSETVLAALTPAEDDAKPAADDDKPDTDGDKPLATVKTDDGLILEIMEVKPTKNETLLIRWRYRNPTNKTIQLIAPTPRFATRSSPPNTAAKFYKSVQYIEGKFQTASAIVHYILVKGDDSRNYNPAAKELGTEGVAVRPKGEYEIYAQFSLPEHKKEKTISISMLNTPLIKNVPIQKAEK